MEEIQRCRSDLCRRVKERHQRDSWCGDYCTMDCYREGTFFDTMCDLKNKIKRSSVKKKKPFVVFPHKWLDVELKINLE